MDLTELSRWGTSKERTGSLVGFFVLQCLFFHIGTLTLVWLLAIIMFPPVLMMALARSFIHSWAMPRNSLSWTPRVPLKKICVIHEHCCHQLYGCQGDGREIFSSMSFFLVAVYHEC